MVGDIVNCGDEHADWREVKISEPHQDGAFGWFIDGTYYKKNQLFEIQVEIKPGNWKQV